jgi:hypothetical protein
MSSVLPSRQVDLRFEMEFRMMERTLLVCIRPCLIVVARIN